jgi:Ala-tRNA(Pro) deacylase
MPAQKLKDFLDSHKIKYVVLKHSPAYTAQEVAATAHISGQEMAKTVIVKIDGKMAMAVLPANYKVDFEQLKKVTGAKKVSLATEAEFKDLCPGCDLGAAPPFGNLYNLDIFVAEKLTHDKEIAFNAGSHTEVIKMAYKDFEKLAKPKVFEFAY